MPITWSAKLIFSTSTNGSAKKTASHRNGTPIATLRPDGSNRDSAAKRLGRARPAPVLAAPGDTGVDGVEAEVLIMSSSLRQHDAAGRRPRHEHVVVPGRSRVAH